MAEAVASYAEQATRGDQELLSRASDPPHERTLAARLLGASSDEIAFVGPTSLGQSLIASGFSLRKGENILVYRDDYPSNVYPWMALAEKGVQVRFLNTRGLGRIRLVDVEGQVDEHAIGGPGLGAFHQWLPH